MPPPHNLLSSSIRDFVCKSCRAKLQIPLKAPRLSRNIISPSSVLQSRNKKQSRLPPKASADSQQHTLEEPIVRQFDQTPDGVRTEVKPDPEEDALVEGLQDAIHELKEDIGDDADNLDLSEVDEEPDLESEFLEPLDINIGLLEEEIETLESLTNKPGPMSDEDRQRIRNYLLKSKPEDQPEASSQTLPVSPPTLSSLPSRPRSVPSFYIHAREYAVDKRGHISQLNAALETAKKDFERKNHRFLEKRMHALWKHYLLCRKALLANPNGVPLEAWGLLWQYVVSPDPLNLDRMAHARRLGMDMQTAGIYLKGQQLLVYIEALFVEGDPLGAIQVWRDAAREFPEDDANFDQFMELGARMFAQNGEYEEARKAASIVINKSNDPVSARILIPIIQGCLSLSKSCPKVAWQIYLEFRKHMGSHIEMSDYDAITSLFIKQGSMDKALAIFKDMMLTGDPAALQYDSLVSHDFSRLPALFKNKFFFGKWIKKLIGDGDLEEASKVLKLMPVCGIRPDARYMNGLIGAWLRTHTTKNRQLAEDMAWSMIAKRLKIVEARATVKSIGFESPLKPEWIWTSNKLDYKSTECNPAATLETFTLLLDHYIRGQKHDKAKSLHSTLKKAQIMPNGDYMNIMFLGESAKSLSQIKDLYYSFVFHSGVRPNLETFRILWLRLKQRSSRDVGSYTHVWSSKQVFSEMIKWAPVLIKEAGDDGFPRDLYDLIITTFGLADDQVGTAVALRALQRAFHIYPNAATIRSITLQVIGIGEGPSRRRFAVNKSMKERAKQVQEYLELLKKQRSEALAKIGISYDDLEGDAQLEEYLTLLCDFLHIVARKKMGSTNESTIGLSQAAANEMGVPHWAPWVEYNSID